MWQYLQDKQLEPVLENLQRSTGVVNRSTLEYYPRLKYDVQDSLDRFKKNIGECEQAWQKHKAELIETLTCLKLRGDVLITQKKVALNQFQKLESFDLLRNELHANIDENDQKIKILKMDIETKKSRFELENEQSETRKALDELKLLVDTKTNDIIKQIKLEQSLAVNPVSLNGDLKSKSSLNTTKVSNSKIEKRQKAEKENIVIISKAQLIEDTHDAQDDVDMGSNKVKQFELSKQAKDGTTPTKSETGINLPKMVESTQVTKQMECKSSSNNYPSVVTPEMLKSGQYRVKDKEYFYNEQSPNQESERKPFQSLHSEANNKWREINYDI